MNNHQAYKSQAQHEEGGINKLDGLNMRPSVFARIISAIRGFLSDFIRFFYKLFGKESDKALGTANDSSGNGGVKSPYSPDRDLNNKQEARGHARRGKQIELSKAQFDSLLKDIISMETVFVNENKDVKDIQEVFEKYELEVKVHEDDVWKFIEYVHKMEGHLAIGGTIEDFREEHSEWKATISNQAPFDLFEVLAEKQAINQNEPEGSGGGR